MESYNKYMGGVDLLDCFLSTDPDCVAKSGGGVYLQIF